MTLRIGNAWENPLFYFKAYTLRNPVVVEALEKGCFDEWCPQCHAVGFVAIRPCRCTDNGAECWRWRMAKPRKGEARRVVLQCRDADPCPCCKRRCPSCRGRKLMPDQRTVCRQDFLDDADMTVAEALIPGITLAPEFNERQLR